MTRTIKRVGWCCFLVTFVFVIIFHQFLFMQLTQWALKTYSISKWGVPLEYDNLSWMENELIISRPYLDHPTAFHADRANLKIHIDIWKRHFHIDISLEEPRWILQMTPSDHWKNFEKEWGTIEKWIKIYPSFHINTGTLSWNDSDSSHQLCFDLDGNSREGGMIKLYFDPMGKLDQYLELQANSSERGMEVNCHCQQVDCPSLLALLQCLNQELIPSCSITSGQLQGHMKAIFSDIRRPYLEGELEVERLDFLQSDLNLNGSIGKASLQFEKNQMAYDLNDQLPTIIGRIEIAKPASLTYRAQDQGWKIDQISGSIQLNPLQTVLINLQASVGPSKEYSLWDIHGKANLNVNHSPDLDLILHCSSQLNEQLGEVRLSLSQNQQNEKQVVIELKELINTQCDLLQNFLSPYWPIFQDIQIEQGKLNALVQAELSSQGIRELHVQHFDAVQLNSRFHPWNVHCHFGRISGQGKVNLEQKNFWQSLQAGIHIEDGNVRFEEMSPNLPITNIQASLLIQQGRVEHSLVTLQVAGLKGKMDVEWGGPKQLLVFKLEGIGQDLVDFLPSVLQEGFRQNFCRDHVMVLANLKRQSQQVELEGTLHIQGENSNRQDLIHFGCDLKDFRGSVSSKHLPFGWFCSHQLPLEKFLSPFIFRNGLLKLSGEAEIKGSFDDHFLTIKYDVDNLKIENEDLYIEATHLHSTLPGQLAGSHQFDLHSYVHQGKLPIQNATYIEKNSGLIFHDIQGVALFENQKIQIKPIEVLCEGIFFSGDLELDYSDPAPSVFNLTIHCPKMVGKVSQVQHLLSHLNHLSLRHKIPLEGEMCTKGDGLQLLFSFIPKDYRVDAEFSGSIMNGTLFNGSSDLALKGIDMDIKYSHEKELLEMTDIQGALLVGKPRRVEEYLFSGQYLRFFQGASPHLEMDIALHDRSYELLRVVGHTQEKDGVKNFCLDQDISHLSSLYPQGWQLDFQDLSQLDKFELRSQFDLGILLRDIQRFRQTGLSILSHQMINKMSQFFPIEGQGILTLRYQPDQGLSYQVEVSRVKMGGTVEHDGILNGNKQGSKWNIDRLQWDEWNAYAELEQREERLKIPFLGLNAGKSLLLGMEGELDPDEGFLQAKLKYCDVNLSEFEDCTAFQDYFTKWRPKGHLKVIGDFEWNFFLSDFWEGFKASLIMEGEQLSLRECPLKIDDSFNIEFKKGQVFSLSDLRLSLFSEKIPTDLFLQRFEYRYAEEILGNVQLKFKIPISQMDAVSKTLQQYFPEICEIPFRGVWLNCKKQGDLMGTLSVENLSSEQQTICLKLEDGLYTFKKTDYEIKDFELKVEEGQMQFFVSTRHEQLLFDVLGRSQWPNADQGSCSLIAKGIAQPLSIHWKKNPQQGFSIRSMQGEFGGCYFHLEESRETSKEEDWAALVGKVTVDINRLCPLLSSDVAETIQKLKLASPYFLIGRFWMNPDLGDTLLETVFFKGKVNSQEPIIKGYQAHDLQGDMLYTPGRLDVKDLIIRDKAGNIKSPSLVAALDQAQNQWELFIPQLTVKNLRLSLLRDTEEPTVVQKNSKFRTLLIKRIELQDFYGKLQHIDTWQAHGNLHFLNPSRKNFFHPLLAIPGEIILRLGLDPQVLNPVTGTIYFNLQGDRFYLTRFKDVYSEGRGSKFYLAQSPYPSWMDFHGNLSVQVRMKQYNLIFKLAELFTVSVRGNIKKPRYTLYKQSKTPHKEQGLSLVSSRSGKNT